MLLLLLGGGCSSFDRAWEAARRQPASLTGIAGPWTGTWQNTNNDHGGRLRALVTPVDAGTYEARFHATWRNKSGGFKSKLRGRTEGGEFVFTSRKRILGFLITTEGRANGTNFLATYQSRFDTGTFTLQRP